MHMKIDLFTKVAMASVHNCQKVSYMGNLSEVARCGRFTLASYAFFIAHKAAGAQVDA